MALKTTAILHKQKVSISNQDYLQLCEAKNKQIYELIKEYKKKKHPFQT